MSSENTTYAQDQQSWCCNNNSPTPQNGFCVQAPNGAQNCNGASQTFFQDGVDGITLVPMGPPPNFPQSGDLCPNPAPLREECMCLNNLGQTVPCQTLIPPPPTPVPTPVPTPTPPPPTGVPEVGCCVESQGVCSLETQTACLVPPNLEYLGVGTTCTNEVLCAPTPTPTPIPINTEGCCVEAEGVCDITIQSACTVPPNMEFMGVGTNCNNVSACSLPPPVTEVPTMSQWGLIATAVMIGLFSLFTVRKGFKNNSK